MRGRALFWALGVGAVLVAAGVLRPGAARARPRGVILFTVDCLRADHLGVAGYPRPTSPRIDAWARHGAVFRDCVAQASWTMPGLASILTGLNPPAHGILARDAQLSAGIDSMPAYFRRLGYDVPDTCFLASEPSMAGFGYPPAARDIGSGGTGELQAALRAEGSRPFFIWYHYRDLHLPYLAPEKYLRMFADPDRWPPAQRQRLEPVERYAVLPYHAYPFKPEDAGPVRDLYDAGVRCMDDRFGAVLDELHALGRDRDTLVILTADHAEELFDHGWVGHASTSGHPTVYQEVVHIPLIMVGPGIAPCQVDPMVRQIDVFPTVAALLGTPPAPPPQGRSLLPAVRGTPLPPAAAYTTTSMAGYRTRAGDAPFSVQGLQDGRWKLIDSLLPTGHTVALYDLQADPHERHDVAAAHPRRAARMEAALTQVLADSRARYRLPPAAPGTAWKGPPPRLVAPRPGTRLGFGAARGRIAVRIAGPPEVQYEVEYQVGTGRHRLDGTLFLRGNHPEFGPFPPKTWDTLAQWNPWRLRLRARGAANAWSPWYQFRVQPRRGGGT